jgi:hypothetical protein
MNLGKTSAIFGTAVGIWDILRNRGRGRHPEPDYAPQGIQGQRKGRNAKFSLDEFTGRINGTYNGLWQSNRYAVKITPKNPNLGWWRKMFIESKGHMSDLTFLCNSASLPGIQIITSDHRRQNFGTFDRRPFGVMATDIPLTFMLDNNGFILDLFNTWTQNIVNYSYKKGEHGTINGGRLFEIAYRDDYLCEIDISTFDQTQTEIHTYHLYEAFPMQVGDITTAWAENDQFAVLPVQFTFRTYDISKQQANVNRSLHGYGGQASPPKTSVPNRAGYGGSAGR